MTTPEPIHARGGAFDVLRRLHYLIPPGLRQRVRRSLMPLARGVRAIEEAVRDIRLPLYRADGVVLIGHGVTSPFVAESLLGEVVWSGPESYFPVWRLRAELERLPASCDVLLLCLGRWWKGALPAGGFFRFPAVVESVMGLPDTAEELHARIRNRETTKELNKIERNGFSWEVTRDPAVADFFFERCHRPHVRSRHGAAASLHSRADFLHKLAEGELLMVKRAGEYVSGCLCFRKRSLYHTAWSGVRDGDPALLRDGALAAEYYFCLQRAIQLGCSEISFGMSAARLDDGVLLFKKKWGAAIRPVEGAGRLAWFGIRRLTPAARARLQRAPILVLERGSLSALVFLGDEVRRTDDELRSWLRFHTFPGCARFHIILLSAGWAARAAAIRALQPDVAIPVNVVDLSGAESLAPAELWGGG
jgi:hypothetical protein